MQKLRNQYIFENIDLSVFSIFDLQKHCSERIHIERENLKDIQPYCIEINAGVFIKPSSNIDFPSVAINFIGSSLILDCSCDTPKARMCTHQAQVLYTIIERQDLLVFFNEKLRHKKLQDFARDYGLENEPNLDEYFQLEHIHNSLRIEPKIKELIKLNSEELERKLLPKKAGEFHEAMLQNPSKKMFLVIKKHRYDDRFSIELFEAETTQSGKVKNPITVVDSSNLIWKTDNVGEAKFFTAISKFENHLSEEKNEADLEALKVVVKNPLNLPTFYHDKAISENVSAKSIVSVDLKLLNADIELSVFKKKPFFEITGGLWLNDVLQPFKNLKIQFKYFLLHEKTLYLMTNLDMLRVLEFFKSNREILLIHSSKFEEFKQNILANLEKQVKINYAYIQPATKKQLAEKSFDEKVEKIIYLADQKDYISITP